MKTTLTSIVFQGEKFWVAKCVELGVVSQGETQGKAEKNLKEAVELFLEDQTGGTIPKNTSIQHFEVKYAA